MWLVIHSRALRALGSRAAVFGQGSWAAQVRSYDAGLAVFRGTFVGMIKWDMSTRLIGATV